MSAAAADTRFKQQIEVIGGIRSALEKCRHHREFTWRVRPLLEEALPGYSVSVEPSSKFHQASIRVWGNGLPFNESVHVCWNTDGDKPWTELCVAAIDRSDPSDYREREIQEAKLAPMLEGMEREMERLRAEAAALIAGLPIPSSATLRKEGFFWERPSSALTKRFPLLFGSMS